MAVLAAAQLLDELMGRHRNTNPNEKIKKPNWEDSEYCKYYLVKFCPHDLFVNTRADLGVCPKVHDDEVKELFEKAESSYKKAQYVEEFLRFCRHMINDVERKIQKGKQRLELMNSKPEGPPMTQAQTEKNQEQVQLLSEKVKSLVQEAEEAGTRGDVEQAQGLMKLCDRLKEEKDQLLKQQENSHWSMTVELAAAQEKQMEVCPVCGAFLIVGDAQQRIDDHLSGKQHVGLPDLSEIKNGHVRDAQQRIIDHLSGKQHIGYFKLRQAYEEMNEAREKELQEKERRRREDRDKDRSSRGGGLGSDRRDRERMERDRERDGDKDRKDRDRSDRERERERDKDRHRSSRDDRSSRHEDRDRDRDRERDRDRKHRKDRRSSRDRSRRRSRDRH
ncbi:luc7-like protein 3 isoform X1 [Amyelois transitella]|uniref:luc7-like protein 3 isoform X1 n=1 Tax=Amyelois transitella TaxID=680683 RepID=UPI00067B11AA|nr:luc7-like protein 3 isoform X1 [Amyelois transitella]